MKISDLFSIHLLAQMIEEGYVRRQYHPSLPYSILNYTETAAFERKWNPVTEACRGLIYNHATDEIVARPFAKFFNYGEEGSPVLHLDTRVTVTDKLDGSLGILYPTGNGQFAVATRGSFTSEQALHATRVWQEKYQDRFIPLAGLTYLFEIIYPSNRIVCDYGDHDDLVFLGAVEIETGQSFDPGETEAYGPWPGSSTLVFRYSTLQEALEAPPRAGAEGYVVRRWFSEDRIKIKQDDYVALHRIITNCTARRLWEYLAVACSTPFGPDGPLANADALRVAFLTRRLMLGPDRIKQILAVGPGWLETFLKNTPEEFSVWVEERVAEMTDARNARVMALGASLSLALRDAGLTRDVIGSPSREQAKRFAEVARSHRDFNLLMTLFRGGEVETAIWRELRPEHELPYRAVDESVA